MGRRELRKHFQVVSMALVICFLYLLSHASDANDKDDIVHRDLVNWSLKQVSDGIERDTPLPDAGVYKVKLVKDFLRGTRAGLIRQYCQYHPVEMSFFNGPFRKIVNDSELRASLQITDTIDITRVSTSVFVESMIRNSQKPISRKARDPFAIGLLPSSNKTVYDTNLFVSSEGFQLRDPFLAKLSLSVVVQTTSSKESERTRVLLMEFGLRRQDGDSAEFVWESLPNLPELSSLEK